MRKFPLTFFLILSGFLAQSNSPKLNKPITQITVNDRHPIIGRIIKLDIGVKAQPKDLISWTETDNFFKRSPNLVLMVIRSKRNNNGYFTREFLFTCTKPLKLTIVGFPVLINQQKYITGPLTISFKADRIPFKLNDIKSIESASWEYLIKALMETGIIILIVLLGELIIFLCIKTENNKNRSANMKHTYLQKLSMIESEINNDDIDTATIINNVTNMMNDFLRSNQSILNEQPRLNPDYACMVSRQFRDIINQLKFQPSVAAKTFYPLFFDYVRHFINSY